MKNCVLLREMGRNANSLTRLALLIVACLLMSSSWSRGVAKEEISEMADSGTSSIVMNRLVAQAQQPSASLPNSVQNAVISEAANHTGMPASQFQVIEAEQRDWPNGCLGIYQPGIACTQVIVPGWRVVVQAQQQEWSFHTDSTGNLVKLANANSPGGNQSYTDIEGHWAQSCIQRLSQQGTISGYPDNTFRPDSPVSRAEYAALLNQAFPDVQTERAGTSFVDVPDDYWDQEAIQTAYRKGFLSGYPDQEFHPDDRVSRVEMFVALASGLDYSSPKHGSGILAETYGDAAEIPAYAIEEIAALTQQGAIVQESSGSNSLNPSAVATRAQVAATLCELKFEDSGVPEGYVVSPVEDPGEAIVLGQTCSNDAAGYTVNYPTGWITNDGEVLNYCQVFDPDSITLPERSSSFDEAIHLRIDSIPFERATGTDDISETILSRRTTTVEGYEAVIEESESTGRGLLQEGVRSYSYSINLDNGEIMVASTYDIATQDYTRNKQVLDQMIGSLRFNR